MHNHISFLALYSMGEFFKHSTLRPQKCLRDGKIIKWLNKYYFSGSVKLVNCFGKK